MTEVRAPNFSVERFVHGRLNTRAEKKKMSKENENLFICGTSQKKKRTSKKCTALQWSLLLLSSTPLTFSCCCSLLRSRSLCIFPCHSHFATDTKVQTQIILTATNHINNKEYNRARWTTAWLPIGIEKCAAKIVLKIANDDKNTPFSIQIDLCDARKIKLMHLACIRTFITNGIKRSNRKTTREC